MRHRRKSAVPHRAVPASSSGARRSPGAAGDGHGGCAEHEAGGSGSDEEDEGFAAMRPGGGALPSEAGAAPSPSARPPPRHRRFRDGSDVAGPDRALVGDSSGGGEWGGHAAGPVRAGTGANGGHVRHANTGGGRAWAVPSTRGGGGGGVPSSGVALAAGPSAAAAGASYTALLSPPHVLRSRGANGALASRSPPPGGARRRAVLSLDHAAALLGVPPPLLAAPASPLSALAGRASLASLSGDVTMAWSLPRPHAPPTPSESVGGHAPGGYDDVAVDWRHPPHDAREGDELLAHASFLAAVSAAAKRDLAGLLRGGVVLASTAAYAPSISPVEGASFNSPTSLASPPLAPASRARRASALGSGNAAPFATPSATATAADALAAGTDAGVAEDDGAFAPADDAAPGDDSPWTLDEDATLTTGVVESLLARPLLLLPTAAAAVAAAAAADPADAADALVAAGALTLHAAIGWPPGLWRAVHGRYEQVAAAAALTRGRTPLGGGRGGAQPAVWPRTAPALRARFLAIASC